MLFLDPRISTETIWATVTEVIDILHGAVQSAGASLGIVTLIVLPPSAKPSSPQGWTMNLSLL